MPGDAQTASTFTMALKQICILTVYKERELDLSQNNVKNRYISMLMSRLSNNMRAETTVYTNLFVRNYLYKILNAQNHRNLRDSISLLGKRDIGNDSF